MQFPELDLKLQLSTGVPFDTMNMYSTTQLQITFNILLLTHSQLLQPTIFSRSTVKGLVKIRT